MSVDNLVKITLLRMQKDSSVGHFVEWSTRFENAAESYGCKFEVVYFSDIDLHDGAKGLIDKLLNLKIEHLFIEWFHDVYPGQNELIEFFRQRNIEWSCLAALSSVYRMPLAPRKIEHPNEVVRRDLERAFSISKLKAVFTFDKFLLDRNEDLPFLPLPDFQDLEISGSTIGCCRFCKSKRPIIGLLGQLYGYRGVTSLIKYWLRNPRLKLFFAGKYDQNYLASSEKFALRFGIFAKSIFFHPSWLTSSGEVNHCISHLDALYIDTSMYPYPSGIAQRARSLGIPIIIENTDSYLRDRKMIDGDTGIFFSDILSFKFRNSLRAILEDSRPFEQISEEETHKALQKGWF